MDVSGVVSNHYKNLVFSFSLPYSLNLYTIFFILFYYIFAYNYLLHLYILNLQKRTITLFTPSRVITIGWINLIFLTKWIMGRKIGVSLAQGLDASNFLKNVPRVPKSISE